MESFSFYPSVIVDLYGKEVEIEPYRVAEIQDYILPLENKRNKMRMIQAKIELLTANGKEPDEKDLVELEKILYEIDILKKEIIDLSIRIAQLGLKRALYPDYSNRIGKELDDLPDVKLPHGKYMEIARVMDELANEGAIKKEDNSEDADTKKEEK